jgi:hypothetical protein
MSLKDIAVDLTCEVEDFVPASTPAYHAEEKSCRIPGQYTFPTVTPPTTSTDAPTSYHVHSGMRAMAQAMGGVGNPVHIAVHAALEKNPEYGINMTTFLYCRANIFLDLVLCGHSLGAGVAAMLGMVGLIHSRA